MKFPPFNPKSVAFRALFNIIKLWLANQPEGASTMFGLGIREKTKIC